MFDWWLIEFLFYKILVILMTLYNNNKARIIMKAIILYFINLTKKPTRNEKTAKKKNRV